MDFEVTCVMHIIIYSLNLSVALCCVLILLIELKVTHKKTKNKNMNMEVKMTRGCRQSGLFSSKVTICWNQSKVSVKTAAVTTCKTLLQ